MAIPDVVRKLKDDDVQGVNSLDAWDRLADIILPNPHASLESFLPTIEKVQRRTCPVHSWSPAKRHDIGLTPTSVLENKEEFVVKMDLPGVHKEDISITFNDDGILEVGTERFEKLSKSVLVNNGADAQADDTSKNEVSKDESNQERLIFSSRQLGSIRKSLRFNNAINKSKIDASYQDGVLEIHLPKKQDVVKKITIK